MKNETQLAIMLFEKVAKCEYEMKEVKDWSGPALLEVFVKGGARKKLGRPTNLKGMKKRLMEKL